MTYFLLLLLAFATGGGVLQTSHALVCEPDQQRHAQSITGSVSGERLFSSSIRGKWTFFLEPSKYGWDLRLRDENGVDLSQITPPFHGPNAREIYGWHFRNTDNTDKNTGDVNAPQLMRLFEFSPALTGTGGLRPHPDPPAQERPDPNIGRGALTILDMGLADLEPGQRARLNYLKFQLCLTWPKTKEDLIKEHDAVSPVFLDEEKESMYGCGLDPQKYQLMAWILPRRISGDLNGDDALDVAAPIIRKEDGSRGLAICRAGTGVSLVGFGEQAKTPLKPEYYSLADYLKKVEFWEMREDDVGNDILILGQIEKSEVGIQWSESQASHHLIWHLVEP